MCRLTRPVASRGPSAIAELLISFIVSRLVDYASDFVVDDFQLRVFRWPKDTKINLARWLQ